MNITFLLKFGQRIHLEDFVNGFLYCSNAEQLWKIEDEQSIKGQGDTLEASAIMYAQNMTLQSKTTNITVQLGQSKGKVRFEPAKKIPVFCMFAVYEEDCIYQNNGKLKINLSEEKKTKIREHFPNADSVIVISNPTTFIHDVENSIGCEIIADSIRYFNIENGFTTNNGQTGMDMEYYRYLCQDTLPVKEHGNTIYKFNASYVYRALQCKDVHFSCEQEYRIILPYEKIDIGTKYPIHLSTKYEIQDLDKFFKK